MQMLLQEIESHAERQLGVSLSGSVIEVSSNDPSVLHFREFMEDALISERLLV